MKTKTFSAILTVAIVTSNCATQQVSYQQDVEPILNDKCLDCHIPPDGKGYKETGLVMETYDSLMKGTVYGSVVIPGDSRRSILNMLAEGRAGKLQQLLHQENIILTESEVDTLRIWVEQGALNN